MDPRRRDLALCLGVLIGSAGLALGLALIAAWLASGVGITDPDGPVITDWSPTDVAQIPAMVLGAGIFGILVARWLRFPGSLLVGFLGMCALTLWMMAPAMPATQPWLSWFALTPGIADVEDGVVPTASLAWHTAYLLAWSWVGVCAIALRHPEDRRPWLAGLGVGVILVAGTGVAQLPAM